jgi:GNAT superfamily N-acetyltransferase
MDSRSIREYFRWRGPWIFFLLSLRELFKPLVYWHVWHIYETDLSRGTPQPYSEPNFDVVLYTARDNLSVIKKPLHSLGELSASEIDTRLERGDVVALALFSGEPVGYMWMGFSDGIELKFDTYWVIRSGEALKYGSFVIPSFRGRGVHSLLNSALNTCARKRGIQRTLGSVSVLNPQSLSLPKRYGRAISMTVFLARFRLPFFTLRKSFRAPLSSRFYWRGHSSPPAKSPLSRNFLAGDQGQGATK